MDPQAAIHAAAIFSGIHADCFLSFLLRIFRNYHSRPHAAHSIVIIAASIIIVILIQLVTLVQRSLTSLLLTLFRLATYSLLYAEAYFVHLQGGPWRVTSGTGRTGLRGTNHFRKFLEVLEAETLSRLLLRQNADDNANISAKESEENGANDTRRKPTRRTLCRKRL